MKFKLLLIIVSMLFISCEKKESPEKQDESKTPVNPGLVTPGGQTSSSGSSSINYMNSNFDWIGQYNGQIYATDIYRGGHLLRFNTSDRKLTLLKKINSEANFKAIAHSMDSQGNIYFYAETGGGNVGIMKFDANGVVIWKKKLNMKLSPYNNTGDMQPAAVKLVNGYLWALSSHFLFKIDPANGDVLNTTGIGSTGDRWLPGQDIIRAGENIMVQMGGGQLYFYILKISDLSVVKTVTTAFTIKPTSGYPTNTILDVADNRFFAVTHYRELSSLFPRGIIIEFDSDGKIINNAIMKDGLGQFEVTRMHRDADGNYAVAFNTHIELTSNLKTKDVLVFNRNLELVHKASLPPALKGSAISFNNSMAAIFNPANTNSTLVEWVDLKMPGCKANSRLTNIKLESLSFKNPVVNTDVAPISTQMSYTGSEDMTYTIEDISYNQTDRKCSN